MKTSIACHKAGYRSRFISMLLAAAIAPSAAFAGEERVVVTIKPLHSLIQGIMGDSGQAVVLVEGSESTHGYRLKPSQAKQLHQADLIFYVDRLIDGYVFPVAEGKQGVHTKDFAVRLLESREEAHGGHDDEHGHDEHKDEHGHDEHGHDGHEDEHGHDEHKDEHGHDEHGHDGHEDEHGHDEHKDEHGHEDEHGHDEHHDHAHGGTDLHIWLDIDNAKAIVRQATQRLAQQYPDNRAIYEKNSKRLIRRLDELDKEIAARLLPLANESYAIFHDAYQYLEKRYNLRPPSAVLSTGHSPSSARRLHEAREHMEEQGVSCIFKEPQFSDRAIRTVTDGLNQPVRVGVLDPLGGELEAGEALYFQLFRQIADNMQECMAPAASN